MAIALRMANLQSWVGFPQKGCATMTRYGCWPLPELDARTGYPCYHDCAVKDLASIVALEGLGISLLENSQCPSSKSALRTDQRTLLLEVRRVRVLSTREQSMNCIMSPSSWEGCSVQFLSSEASSGDSCGFSFARKLKLTRIFLRFEHELLGALLRNPGCVRAVLCIAR